MDKRSLNIIILCIFLSFFFQKQSRGQDKRPLTHADYDQWQSISQKSISVDGNWVGYQVNPQEGDGEVTIANYGRRQSSHRINRGKTFRFSADSEWAVGLISPQEDTIRNLKLKEIKKEKFPKDSLFLLSLKTGEITKTAGIKRLELPEKNKNWFGILKSNPTDETEKSDEDSTAKKKEELYPLELHRFSDQIKITREEVLDFGFDKEGNYIFLVQGNEPKSSLKIINLEENREIMVSDSLVQYKSVVFSDQGSKLAFLGSTDKKDAENPYFQLFIYDLENEEGSWVKVEEEHEYFTKAMTSGDHSPSFSKDGLRLFFGIKEDYKVYEYEEDSTILDEERVKLDIWGWQDQEIQPMQLNNREDELKKSYLAVYLVENSTVTLLEHKEMDRVLLNKDKTNPVGLGLDDQPYRRNYSWDVQIGQDFYAIDVDSGVRTLIGENIVGYPSISPSGKFAFWYQNSDSTWMAFDFEQMEMLTLTNGLDVKFYDELHDSPSIPGSYGYAGWTQDDEFFLVYDRYDLWKLDPTGEVEPLNLTMGNGRSGKIEYRAQDIDEETEFVDMESPLYLNGMDMDTKESGYFKADWSGNAAPEPLIFGPYSYYGLEKAEDAKRFIYQKSTYKDSPDLYVSDLEFKDEKMLSSLNPQQQDIRWGEVELVDYMTNDGGTLNGLLFKPEGFDPEKKYPMMVYFYERSSDGLFRYRSPVPSASVINIPYFVSNGYLVFVPDIKYKIGLPGPSAYDCVVPGVQQMIAKGFVDSDNIGIQGQSWGGYQAAYIITRTDLFKAAGTGAPVANMTSAYGGIRWGTGMSRMFQYEQTQSRIGGTLWEKPMHYIENSPLFFADRISTPTLIMHNDADGAVPWYQGIEFFMALKRNNVPSWLLVYNGEDHNLKERKNKKDLSIRLSQFFDHYLKNEPAPLWMTEGLPAVEKGKTLKYELSE